MAKWIDCMDFGVGAIGYLVSTDNSNTRAWNVFSLRERPLRTNMSREPRLTGWCGETDNVSRTAMGVWRVVRMNAAGDRAQIVQVTGADLAAFLERDGYPELIPADLRVAERERGAVPPARPQRKRKHSYCAACCSAPCRCAEVADVERAAIERDAESLSRPT